MRTVITLAATAALASAQGWMTDAAKNAVTSFRGAANGACCKAPLLSNACQCQQKLAPPTVKQLAAEPYRCGCPMPKAAVPNCPGALAPVSQGCGCQPRTCNPPPRSTKVLTVQCHDVTTYSNRPVTKMVNKMAYDKVPKTRMEKRPKTTYKPVKAIRYKMVMKKVKTTRKEQRMVKKTIKRPVQRAIQVPAAPRTDCCGRVIPEP